VISTSLFFSIHDNWTTHIPLQLNVIEHLGFIFIFFVFLGLGLGLNFNPNQPKTDDG